MIFLIKKNGEYLVGLPYPDSMVMRWSVSPWDGARIYKKSIAEKVADKVGGLVVKFDQVTGRVTL